jgi:hypothetical protein
VPCLTGINLSPPKVKPLSINLYCQAGPMNRTAVQATSRPKFTEGEEAAVPFTVNAYLLPRNLDRILPAIRNEVPKSPGWLSRAMPY